MASMDPERWRQIETLYFAALEQPAAARTAFLATSCADDEALRTEVEALLAAGDDEEGVGEEGKDEKRDGKAAGRLARAVEGTLALAAAAAPQPTRPTRIGPYRIRHEIGRGGLGTVYLAERDDAHFKKQVAIKVVRRGMDTEDILARMRQERQILASLEHPYIARLLDGGSTDAGLPYFVMEYIEGETIDVYCDQHRLPVPDRLRLFRQVCAAVQYAHRNLVIHRDLKPGNLLVTADGTPKLLDFGIAKLLAPGSVPTTALHTATGLRLLTPDYASPEQIRGAALTTATDVYALGVLLYRLLTGTLPHTLQGLGPQELERAICDIEPQRPSTAIISGDAAVARGEPSIRLRRRLAGDLDNIVMMALRKEPERRYGSADQLAADILRYLERQPVMARKDTLSYRAARFVARYKVAVIATGLVLLSLLAGLITTTWQARRARAQQARAEQVSDFLVDLFNVNDPSEARGEEVKAIEILDRGAEQIGADLEAQPETRAELMSTMGRVYQNLGLYPRATPLLENALHLRRTTRGADPIEVAESLNDLGALRYLRGDYEAAEVHLREALALRKRLRSADHPEVTESLNDLAVLLDALGQLTNAEAHYREVLALQEASLDVDDPALTITHGNLAENLYRQGNYAAAAPLFRRVLVQRRIELPARHPQLAIALNNLAATLLKLQRYDEVEPLWREALAIRRAVLGDAHPQVATLLNNLADLHRLRGDSADAEALYREALATLRAALGPEHESVTAVLNNLADLLAARGEGVAAEPLYRESLRIRRAVLPTGHWRTAYPLTRLGALLLDRGDAAAAEPLLREAVAIRRQARPDDWGVAEAESLLGACLAARGHEDEAAPLLHNSLARLEALRGAEDEVTQAAHQRLAAIQR